jgi:hypothetical protein
LAEAYSGPIPELPPIHEWSEDTLRRWQAIWRSPMATQWLESDAEALYVLAVIRQQFLEGDTRVAVAREIRLNGERFRPLAQGPAA